MKKTKMSSATTWNSAAPSVCNIKQNPGDSGRKNVENLMTGFTRVTW